MTGKASVSMQGLRSARGILTGLCVHFWMSFIGLKVFLYWFVMTFFFNDANKVLPLDTKIPHFTLFCFPLPSHSLSALAVQTRELRKAQLPLTMHTHSTRPERIPAAAAASRHRFNTNNKYCN